MSKYEFETFRKCIENQFGPDMERKILTNFYTNYGDTKNIFEYMFQNLYSEKTTKLVKLNLEVADLGDEDNQRKVEARLKNIELKKQLAKVKGRIEQEDLETISLCRNITEQEKKIQKSEADYRNKEVSSLAQDIFIKKVQDVCNKFKTASQSLNFISEENTNELEQVDLESLVSKLKVSGNNESMNTDGTKMKKVDLNEAANYCNGKINDDGERTEQITGLKYLNNEVELLIYQLDSKLFNSGDNRKPNLNIFERINENHFENIRRDCEQRQWSKEKALISSELKEVKIKLYEYLTRNFKDTSQQLYVQYLASYMTFKRVETTYKELKSNLVYLEKEINALKEVTSTTADKSRELKELNQMINEKQLKLDQLLDENTQSLDSTIQFNICQMKSSSEALLELINAFNSDQFNKTRSDMTLQSNMTTLNNQNQFNLNPNNLIQQYNQFKLKFQAVNNQRVDEFTPENRSSFKKLFNYAEYKDQKGLFDQFLSVFKKIKTDLVELDKLNRNQSRYKDIKQLTMDLGESLKQCQSIDMNELFKYIELLSQNTQKINDSRPVIEEIEKLITIWQNQPGAYECIPDDLTVSGKTLGYYVDILEKTKAHTEKLTFAQGEQIHEQIGHLIMQCSSIY